MKSSVVQRDVYVRAHGVPARSGGSLDPEIAALWNKVQKLQVATSGNGHGGGEYVVVEPDKDEDLRQLRARVYSGIRNYTRRMRPPTFSVRMLLRRDESHIIVWRELLRPAQPHATAEQTTKLDAPSEPPRDKREKVRPTPVPPLTEVPRVAATMPR